jgi:UDP-3-O-[3-hydroxymyristoyl] N-acetylglucosamine deacetylase
MIKQRTLKNVIRATGVGLHGGEKAVITLRPAPIDTGIVFSRTDLNPRVDIRAHALNVVDTRLATTLGRGEVRIAAVEHLMSALAGLGIDNARVEVNAGELPVMDGSAAPFVFLIQSAGIEEQDAPRKFLRVMREIRYGDSALSASLAPHEGFKVSYSLEFDNPELQIHPRSATLEVTPTSYVKEVSRARTFGFLQDYESLQGMNLDHGGSFDDAAVLDEARVAHRSALRYRDEFVRHKILDAIGDLYLLGHGLIGRFDGNKSDHSTNNELLRSILECEDACELVTFDEAPIGGDRRNESR